MFAALITSNGIIYNPLPDVNMQALTSSNDSAHVLCKLTLGLDQTTYTISRDNGATTTPILVSTQLPTGMLMSYNKSAVQFGCFADSGTDTGTYVLVYDTVKTQTGGSPGVGVFYASTNGTMKMVLDPGVTQFPGVDPANTSGPNTTFTFVQAATLPALPLNVRNGLVTVYGVIIPAKGNSPIAPNYAAAFVQIGTNGPAKVLFNNTKDSKLTPWFGAFGTFTVTDNYLYLAAVPATGGPTDKSAVGIYRVANGTPVMVKDFFDPVGKSIASWNNGVQIYAVNGATTTTPQIVYTYLPDNSPAIGQGTSTERISGTDSSPTERNSTRTICKLLRDQRPSMW